MFCLFSSDSFQRGLKIPAWLSGRLIKHELQKQPHAAERGLGEGSGKGSPSLQAGMDWCQNCVLTGNDFYLLAGEKHKCQIKDLFRFYVGELRLLVAFLAWMLALKLKETTTLSNLDFWWCVLNGLFEDILCWIKKKIYSSWHFYLSVIYKPQSAAFNSINFTAKY